MKSSFLLLQFVFISLFFFSHNSFGQLLDSMALENTEAYTSIEEAMKNPEKVIKLNLRKCKLKEFPKEILRFTNLQYLDISKNSIREIPDEIDTLVNLQFLTMSRNKIISLPPNIGKLKHLKYLNVNQNDLNRLPSQIGQLKELIQLDLWSNDMEEFPEELSKLKNLRTFDLRAILISDHEQKRLQELLPHTTIFMSPSCKCEN